MIDAIRFFDMQNINDIERMTLYEYNIKLTAYRLKRLDKDRDIHWQAFKNLEIQSTVGVGKNQKPKFKNFKEFFDYEKQQNEILGKEAKVVVKQDKKTREILEKAGL